MSGSSDEQAKQIAYRDARFSQQYDQIWQNVGKCVFCDLRDKYIFFEENGVVMTISLYAYIDGHLMIMPRRHVRSAKELSEREWQTVRKFSYIAKKLIRDVHDIKGMQLVQKDGASAQSTVDQHLHFHCIPFDAPDLLTWNYRQLHYTPLENVALYKKAARTVAKLDQKFTQKYARPDGLRVDCDAIIVNDARDILFTTRPPSVQLVPNYITLPGGIVDDFDRSLEDELIREVREETGLQLRTADIRLLASRIGQITRRKVEPHLQVAYPLPDRFVWNTYLFTGTADFSQLQPGDDSKTLVWVPLQDVAQHPRISDAVKQVIAEHVT